MFREMRRKKQQTTQEECVEILQAAKRGVLAVSGDEGYPYAVPLDFVYEDGYLYFHCAKAGHKLDAIRKNEKVSFCVLNAGRKEENDWWYHFISVIAFGRIREVEDPEKAIWCLRLLGRKYMPTREMVEDDIRKNGQNACVLALEIEHMTGKRIREN